MKNKKAFATILVMIAIALFTLSYTLVAGKSKEINDNEKMELEHNSEVFIKKIYSMKPNESFHAKKESVEGIITKKFSGTLFEGRDSYNLYGDITVEDLKVSLIKNHKPMTTEATFIKVVPDLTGDGSGKKEIPQNLDLIFKNVKGKWLIDEMVVKQNEQDA